MMRLLKKIKNNKKTFFFIIFSVILHSLHILVYGQNISFTQSMFVLLQLQYKS
jgi:hypothetical protein